MTHYTNIGVDGKRTRHSTNIVTGDWVRSRYRAPWYGVVLAISPQGVATVRMERSRRGAPLRKTKEVRLHVDWLKKAEEV